MATPALFTAEEFERMSDGGRSELVRGRVVPMNPPGGSHGDVAVTLSAHLFAFVEPRALGRVFGETGFVLARNPDTVRGPDVSFVRAARLAGGNPTGYFEGAPDLAVEIRSPDNSMADLFAKAAEYQEAGSDLIWLVQPEAKRVTVLVRGRQPQVLETNDVLDGGDVLPGFRLRLAELFRA